MTCESPVGLDDSQSVASETYRNLGGFSDDESQDEDSFGSNKQIEIDGRTDNLMGIHGPAGAGSRHEQLQHVRDQQNKSPDSSMSPSSEDGGTSTDDRMTGEC